MQYITQDKMLVAKTPLWCERTWENNEVCVNKKLPLVEAGIQYKMHKHQEDHDMNNMELGKCNKLQM